jgi:hypothetical protein
MVAGWLRDLLGAAKRSPYFVRGKIAGIPGDIFQVANSVIGAKPGQVRRRVADCQKLAKVRFGIAHRPEGLGEHTGSILGGAIAFPSASPMTLAVMSLSPAGLLFLPCQPRPSGLPESCIFYAFCRARTRWFDGKKASSFAATGLFRASGGQHLVLFRRRH